MVNLKTFLKGEYIRPAEIKHGDLAVIIEEPRIVATGFKDSKGNVKNALEGLVEKEKEQRILTWNKPNTKRCSNKWGEETQAWVGKVVVLSTSPQLISGQMKDVIVITPREEPVVKPDWLTEDMITAKVNLCSGLINRDAAISIILKEESVKVKQ